MSISGLSTRAPCIESRLKLAYLEQKQAALAPLTQEVEALTATIASLETKMGQEEEEEEEEVPAQVVTLLVETQLILPMYLEGRKASHWPYKMLRCKREGDEEWGSRGQHTDPGGMRAALLQFLEDIATQ